MTPSRWFGAGVAVGFGISVLLFGAFHLILLLVAFVAGIAAPKVISRAWKGDGDEPSP